MLPATMRLEICSLFASPPIQHVLHVLQKKKNIYIYVWENVLAAPFYRMSHGTSASSEHDWNAAIIARIDIRASELPSLTRLFKGSNEWDLRHPLAVANDRNISAAELSIAASDPKKYSSEQGVGMSVRHAASILNRSTAGTEFFKLSKVSAHQILEDFWVWNIPDVSWKCPNWFTQLEYDGTNWGLLRKKRC